MSNLFDLHGKVAWVTGASVGGLGYYQALALAEHGAHVALSDLSSRANDLAEAKSNLERKNLRAIALHTDVTNPDDVRDTVTNIDKEFGRIDILVNNAGVTVDVPALEMRLEDWNRVLNVNLTGVWLCSRATAEAMIKRRIKGKIINIASVGGLGVSAFLPSSPYYATKAAVINLTRALAVEWAPYGINVNAIGPGVFHSTGMTRQPKDAMDDAWISTVISRTPLKRAGDPARDLAGTLVFLASQASDYVTGQTIVVDGGRTAGF